MSQHVLFSRSSHKRAVARIGLNLDSKIGSCGRDIQAVLELLDVKLLGQPIFRLSSLFHGDHEIEVQLTTGST